MNQTKSTSKKLLALLLALIMTVSLLPMSVFAADANAGYTLNADSRFFVVSENDPTGTELGQFVQLIDSEFAAKELPGSTVLPLKYGAESDAQDGDILVKIDSSLGEQSYQIVITAARITVTGGDAAGVYYGLTELLQMFEKNTTLAAQEVENSPLVKERSVYIDCGRVYYSPDLLKALIKTMAWNKMNTLYLDFSNNNATRFFLDSMTVTVDGASVAAQAEPVADVPVVDVDTAPVVTDAAPEAAVDEVAPVVEEEPVQDVPAVQTQDAATMAGTAGTYNIRNAIPSDGEYLSQADMDSIIAAANEYGVQIIPTFNSPGHIGGLYSLNNSYFDKGSATDYDRSCGKITLLIGNADAYEFGIEVNKLYIDYFASKGCKSFNIAADEATLGNVKYDSNNTTFVRYVNELNTYIKSKGMTARMFNDGIKSVESDISEDIIVLYWAPDNNAESFVNGNRSVVNFSYGAGLYYAYGASWWVWNQSVQTIYGGWYPGALCRDTDNQNNYIVTEKIDSSKLLGANFAVWSDYAYNYNYDGTKILNSNNENVVDKIQVVAERCWMKSSTDSYSTWKNSLTTAPGGINVSNYSIDSTTLPVASAFEKVSIEPELVVDETGETTVTPAKQSDGSYSVAVKTGDTVKLKVNNYSDSLTWASDNAPVATVDQFGKVTFTGVAGTVTITAAPATATYAANDSTNVFSATFVVTQRTGGDLTDMPAYTEGKVTGSSTIEYEYVLDTDGVDANEKYLIVAANSDVALRRNNSNLATQSVTISGNKATITSNADTSLWTFGGAASGTITNDSYYLRHSNTNGLGVSGSNNNNNNSWTITSNDNGTYQIYYSGQRSSYYLNYSSSFTLATSASNVRLYKQQAKATGFTVDTANLAELIDYAKRLTAGEFSNRDTVTAGGMTGMDTVLAAAENALNAVSNPYDNKTAADNAQSSVNTAAQNLHDALAQLAYRASVTITVYCEDESGTRIGEANGYTFYAYQNAEGTYTYTFNAPTITGYRCNRGSLITGNVAGEGETVTLVYRKGSFTLPDSIEIPITIVDYRADGLLFDFSIGNGDACIAYQLVQVAHSANRDTAQNAISGTKLEQLAPQDNAAADKRPTDWSSIGSGAYIRTGMVEETLGANGMPVYTDATVRYVANKLAQGICRTDDATITTEPHGTNAKNWNDILYNTFLKFGAARSVRNSTTTGFSPAFANTKSYDNITNAYDLAWYLLNTLYIGDDNMAEVTVNVTQETYTLPIYGMADNTYNKLILVKEKNGTYYMKAYTDGAKLKYDEANGAIYNSASDNSNTSKFMYPLCGKGYDAYLGDTTDNQAGETATTDGLYPAHPNGNYTLRGESQFVYYANQGQYFEFTGDDDVYLFINGKLALDLGGAHWSLKKTVNMDDIAEKCGLEDGQVATFTFFYMERFSDCSNFGIRTNMGLVERGINVEKKGYDTTYSNVIANGSRIENNTSVAYDLTVTNQGDSDMNEIKFEDTDKNGATVSIGFGVTAPVLTSATGDVQFKLSQLSGYALFITDHNGVQVANSRKEFTKLEALSNAVGEITLTSGQTLHVRFLQVMADVEASKMADYSNTVTVTAVSGGQPLTDSSTHVLYAYNAADTAKDYVVDFGLPLKITNIFDETSRDYFAHPDKSLTLNSTYSSIKYGTLDIGGTGFDTVLTYTPEKAIDEVEKIVLDVAYKFDSTFVTLQKTIRIIPASTVYYEDDFMSFTNKDNSSDVSTAITVDNGFWQSVGRKAQDVYQALDKLGDENANNYGYDPAYNSCTEFSLGSAVKVTVDANVKSETTVWPYATFTFKGTGFDIISLTDNTSGAIYVDIYKGDKVDGAQRLKGYVVNNYYGYTYNNQTGEWEIRENTPNATYQVPVIKASGLEYAQYTVKIMVGYSAYQDVTDNNKYSFWMDAIRVYDPVGTTPAIEQEYQKDGEQNPDFVQLRKVLLDAGVFSVDTTVSGAVFIDGMGETAIVDNYKSYGPNHEVYLAGNQAIAFRLVANAEPKDLQLGAKLANGNNATLTVSGATFVKGNDTSLPLTTATDMFYELNVKWTKEGNLWKSDVITLTNTGDSMISLTNLKLIDAEYANSVEAVANAAESQVLVTMMMDAAIAQKAVAAVDSVLNPQEVKTFTPERFEASWNRSTVKVGQKATLTVKTSTDVDAITVDGVTIDTYRTRTERTGWGWNAKRVTYREFTYTITASESGTLNCSVAAINAEGTASEAITAALTVQAAAQRPSWGSWLGSLFDRWF